MSPTALPVVRPGGGQTRVKLSICSGYFQGFARASTRAIDRVYIDGFASSGRGIDHRTGAEYAGSALRCLEVEPPFTDCYLVEQNPDRAAHLKELTKMSPNAHVISGDANLEIPNLLRLVHPKAAALAFLDPDGTQLHWTTVEALSNHKRGHSKTKIELVITFPLQMAILRLLDFKTGKTKPAHARRLDAMLGGETPWRELVAKRMTGEHATPKETELAFLDAYCDGLHRRLEYAHVLHRAVANESGRELYYLIFASDSDVGRAIMKYEFGASHTEQAQLFNLAEFTPGLDYDPDKERPYRL